jgi:hypothetical protein
MVVSFAASKSPLRNKFGFEVRDGSPILYPSPFRAVLRFSPGFFCWLCSPDVGAV